jgi:hypothetical protein
MPGGRRNRHLKLLVGGIPNNQLFDVVDEMFNLKFFLGIELLWLFVKFVLMQICMGVVPGHISGIIVWPPFPSSLLVKEPLVLPMNPINLNVYIIHVVDKGAKYKVELFLLGHIPQLAMAR